jgi:ubiquinone/menaquinone biosynthesis C-methylase UbiE
MPESLSFDRVATRYDATRGYTPEVAARIADGLIRFGEIPPGGSVIEIGIGTGRIALPLLARGVHMTGVDIAPRMLEQLQAKYDALRQGQPDAAWGVLATRVADMTALPFPDGGFDAAVAVHVLHLVPEWRRALDEALRVVRPGRYFLLGQDISSTDAVNHRIQDRWVELARELGSAPIRVGARNTAEVLEALRGRGLAPEETTLASWTTLHTPRSIVQYVADRTWSQTWSIPDAIFAESVRRLDAWVGERYAAALDMPMPTRLSFKAVRVRV